MTTPPQAIIFDLDGTLADTFDLIVSSWNAACAGPMGRTYAAEEVIARFGPTEGEMLRRELPEASHASALRTFLTRYEQDHASRATVFEGVPGLLNLLRRQRVPMGVMTGKGRDTADISLRALGWSRLFSSVVTGDDISRPKPDPEGVLLVARQLGVDPRRCAFVGDAPADIRAGKAAGMTTIWAGWHPVYADEVRSLHPDHIANAPIDVARICGFAAA
jgi:phosphoglycolate phosphatase/pyrophosphatase PpaX